MEKMKKAGKILVFTLIMIMALSACGKNVLIENAKSGLEEFSTTDISAVQVNEDNYGDVAYRYLEHIQENYPGRLSGSEKEQEMAEFILQVLLEAGYTQEYIEIQPFEIPDTIAAVQDMENSEIFDGGKQTDKSNNIEVTKKGDSEKMIIVGAHYDSVGTHGVDDNGSGVVVMLENALRILDQETPYTIRYVFFGAEEIGLFGSRAYVDKMSQKEKDNTLLMINIDSVLVGDIPYIYGGRVNSSGAVQDTWAVEWACEVAQEMGLDIQLPPKEDRGHPFPTQQNGSDHAPFNDLKIPYLYFQSGRWENGNLAETEAYGLVMHSKMDDLDFVNEAFPDRAKKTLSSYSKLLSGLLEEECSM